MKRYITGVGSRETPWDVRIKIFQLAKKLISLDFILRSGGADGADTYWEEAFDYYKGKKEIFLPWKRFNKNESTLYDEPPQTAYDIAARIHPVWHKLSASVKNLHARNVLQVLGKDIQTPAELVICWTADGKASGGTATAINLAEEHKIPVFNLFNKDDESTLDNYLAWSIFE